jgi:hypothetical protein
VVPGFSGWGDALPNSADQVINKAGWNLDGLGWRAVEEMGEYKWQAPMIIVATVRR